MNWRILGEVLGHLVAALKTASREEELKRSIIKTINEIITYAKDTKAILQGTHIPILKDVDTYEWANHYEEPYTEFLRGWIKSGATVSLMIPFVSEILPGNPLITESAVPEQPAFEEDGRIIVGINESGKLLIEIMNAMK